MNKSIQVIFGTLLLASCQENDTPLINSTVDNNQTKVEQEKYSIPIDSALRYLNEYLTTDYNPNARSFETRKVSEIYPINFASFTTRAQSKYIDCENLVYIANFENDEGYAILAADERIPDKVIAITDQGSLNTNTIKAATNSETNGMPFFTAYPPLGPGFFTLEEYGDELFMNPNTVSLFIESVDDTLVGNFDGECESNINQNNLTRILRSNQQTQSDLFAVGLCISYALQTMDNHKPVPLEPGQDPDPIGGEGGITYDKTTTTTSDWKKTKDTPVLLDSYVTWHQDSPFNDFYPERRSWLLLGKKRKAPAGCFPLAISKILTNLAFPEIFSYNGLTVNWEGLKDKSSYDVDKTSASALLYSISLGCNSWYFYQGTFTFPSYATDYMRFIGFKNVKQQKYKFDYVENMIDNNKPLIIYSVPGIEINKSHSWNLDGYKIKERTVTTNYYYKDKLVTTRSRTELSEMVHCDFGWRGMSNGYYVSGVFKLGDTSVELDPGPSNTDETNYKYYLHVITYDLP